ncbi:MAG: DUF2179 domain-containing protein [Candidatus Omnitrophota bacterium]
MPEEFSVFQYVVLPLLIFLARVCDVSMDTMRILFIGRGKRLIAAMLGFVQVLIWLLAIRQVILNISTPLYYLAYAGGFATGTWIGIMLEEKLAIGIQVIRVITHKEASNLIEFLKDKGYRLTYVDGYGTKGKVSIIYTIVKRQAIRDVIDIIVRFNPQAFYTIEDVRTMSMPDAGLAKKRLFKRSL